MKDRLCIRFFFFLFVVATLERQVEGLTKGGAHVCSQVRTYNAYTYNYLYRVGYRNYRTCCSRIIGICAERCTRYRTTVVGYYRQELRIKYYDYLYCCSGWAPSGQSCPIPICNPGCKYGTCVSPQSCRCQSGIQGRICDTDINECLGHPCDQVCTNTFGSYYCGCNRGWTKKSSDAKDPHCVDVDECKQTPSLCKCDRGGQGGCRPTCQNTIGSFRCGCSTGFKLFTDQRTCIDIDECKSSALNKCNQICINVIGSYACACKTGYKLGPDKHTCTDIDECKTLHGGCNQICTNTPGSFYCSCRKGYELGKNKRTCIDINECKTIKPCDNEHGTCHNTMGSYWCGCLTGFQIQADNKTCKDIDECATKTDRCSQYCHNTIGSYTCSCREGYKLNPNGYGCDDIDECKLGTHKCQQLCTNTVGSYKCSCRPGYTLNPDKRNCTGNPCRTLTKIMDGQISCTGHTTDQNCTFKCNIGYSLSGSIQRTCLPTGVWSGAPAVCNRKECGELPPPAHGSVLEPCDDHFESMCVVRCGKGYYMNGTKASECAAVETKMKWLPHNATWQAAKPCTPNPCEHNGRCHELNGNKYSCECSGTSYHGDHCDRGVITTPSYPQLTVGVTSEELTFSAKPDHVLQIRPIEANNALVFNPAKIVIHPSTPEVTFTVTATRPGAFTIRYQVVGMSSYSFEPLKEDKVYAYHKTAPLKAVDVSTDFHEGGCKEKRLLGRISLLSSCEWRDGSNGFITVKGAGIELPLSLVGISESEVDAMNGNDIINPIRGINTFLQTRSVTQRCQVKDQCRGFKMDASHVNYITSSNIFQRAFYQQVNKLLPSSLHLRVNMADTYFASENFVTLVGKGSVFVDNKMCPDVPFSRNDVYSLYLPKALTDFYFGSSRKGTEEKDKKTCVAVNLDNRGVDVSLDKGQDFNFEKSLTDAGLGHIKATLGGFGYGRLRTKCVVNTPRHCQSYTSYWKITASMAGNPSGVSLQLNGLVFANMTDKTLLDKFSRQNEAYLEGVVDYNIKIKMFGDWLKIQGTDKTASGHLKLGGGITCPICDRKGLTVSLAISDTAFQYTSSILRFEPSSNVNLYIPHDMSGGETTTVKNRVLLKLRTRQLSAMVPKKIAEIATILKALNKTEESAIVRKYCDQVTWALKKLLPRLGRHHPSNNVAQLLRQVKDKLDDCGSQLKSLNERVVGDRKLSVDIKLLHTLFTMLQSMDVVVNNARVERYEQGKIVSYAGRFCFHAFCLDNMHVRIYDLSDDILANKDCASCAHKYRPHIRKGFVSIDAVADKEMNVSSRIKFALGSSFKVAVDKNSETVIGEIHAFVNLFNRDYKTVFTIQDNNIRYRIDNVQIPGGALFTVEGSQKASESTWSRLVHKIRGSSKDIADNLHITGAMLYKNISEETEKRLKENKDRLNEAKVKLQSGQSNTTTAQKKLASAKRERRKQESAYNRYVKSLSVAQDSFDSYLKTLDKDFIKRSVESICKLPTCVDTCHPIPVCQLCFEAVKVTTTTWDCHMVKEIIRASMVVEVNKTCEVTYYLFKPRWTGDCDPDPAIQKQMDSQLQKVMIQTGAEIGSLVGSAILPGVGSVVGSVIGACIGAICSLFHSCDSSVVVDTIPYIVQKSCTVLISKVVAIPRMVSKCLDLRKKVDAGFKAPSSCNCVQQECAVKAKDPDCLTSQLKCQRKRTSSLQQSKKVPTYFTELFKRLHQLKDNVASTRIRVQSARRTSDFCQREYERTSNALHVIEEEVRYATQSDITATKLLATETCILRAYKVSKDLKDHVVINGVGFDQTLPVVENIRLNIDVKRKTSTQRIPFVWEFSGDATTSLNTAGKKLIVQTMCEGYAFASAATRDLPFKPWGVSASTPATTAQIACTTFTNTLKFLTYVFKNLRRKADHAFALRRQLDASRGKLLPTLAVAFRANTNVTSDSNSVVKANRDLLTSALKEVSEGGKQVSAEYVKKIWLHEVEVFTAVNNMTVCLGTIDCVNEAITSLQNLPAMLRVSRGVYTRKVRELNDHIFSAFKAGSLEEVRNIAEETLHTISAIECVSSHCVLPPKVTLKSPSQITAEVGDTIHMECETQSELPVVVFWTLHNKMIDGKHENVLKLLNVELSSEGVYKCYATSLAGNGTTQEVTLKVVQAPHFIEEPSDVTYVIPSEDEVKVMLTCNATAVPDPTIYWYFSPCDKPTANIEIRKGAGKMLVIDKPRPQNSGFYYCKVKNTVAEIRSRRVRVNVLSAVLTSARYTLHFNIPGLNRLKPGLNGSLFTSLVDKMKKPFVDMETKIQVSIRDGDFINIDEDVRANAAPHRTNKQMMKLSSKLRRAISNSGAIFIRTLLVAKSKLKLDDGRVITVASDTLTYALKLNICKAGYTLHHNGYLCVPCPCGFAGSPCAACPLNTFAQGPGQSKCTHCTNNTVTIRGGRTSISQCIPKPHCSVPCNHGTCVGKDDCRCDQGWIGRLCENAVCRRPCKNGKCTSPDKCHCNAGWDGKLCREDINECASKTLNKCNQICRNTIGSYSCACDHGYKLGVDKHTCIDIDECKTRKGICSQICINKPGTYECRCRPGYKLKRDRKTCTDIDECKSPFLNKCNQKCRNTPGSYVCSCNPGYVLGPDKHTCTDLDECKTKSLNKCNQECTNTPGSYVCSCNPGYLLGPDKHTCKDVDECKSTTLNKCNQICTNTPGSYVCSCNPGYVLGPDKHTCTDIDECVTKTAKCAQVCHNTVGSYTCSCYGGYRLNKDGYSCDDVDECKEGTHHCQQICINTRGSYTCACRHGFKLGSDKKRCIALAGSADMVVLVDVSTQHIHNEDFKHRLVELLQRLVDTYEGDSSKRFGFVTFDTLADTRLQLKDFTNITQLSSLFGEINPLHPNKSSSAGLTKVRLDQDFEDEAVVKKIVFIFTNGFSKGSRLGDGFHTARKEAILLQRKGVHLISVGISTNIDEPEITAIASYPKLINSIITPDDTDKALSTALKVTKDVLAGKCYQPHIDIGILFKPRYYKDVKQYYADQKRLLVMFQSIYEAFPTGKYYFAEFNAQEEVDPFDTYTPLKSFLRAVKTYLKTQTYWFDIMDRSREVLGRDFDEKLQKSLAKVKSFIVLSENALLQDQVKSLNEVNPTEVGVVNFALESKSVKKDTSGHKMIFSFEEVQLYIRALEASQSKRICT